MSTQPPPVIAYAAQEPNAADAGYLKALAICHWVAGGLTALFACFGLLYIFMGWAALTGKMKFAPPPTTMATARAATTGNEADFIGWFFVGMGSIICVLGWSLAGLTVLSGINIMKRKRRVFSIVIAAINCAFFPLGTVLGVFTIIVLVKDSVQRMYAFNAEAAATRRGAA